MRTIGDRGGRVVQPAQRSGKFLTRKACLAADQNALKRDVPETRPTQGSQPSPKHMELEAAEEGCPRGHLRLYKQEALPAANTFVSGSMKEPASEAEASRVVPWAKGQSQTLLHH
jgi:hypothetical protein